MFPSQNPSENIRISALKGQLWCCLRTHNRRASLPHSSASWQLLGSLLKGAGAALIDALKQGAGWNYCRTSERVAKTGAGVAVEAAGTRSAPVVLG
jgi:hypothetical protein